MIRTYDELMSYDTLEDRFAYLSLSGQVGDSTFGSERWLNQRFYRSREWRDIRQEVIARDLGCDLAIEEYPVHGPPQIHHMNPINVHDIVHATEYLLEPRYLITTSHRTHNAIHYGDENLLPQSWVERKPGDTKLW